MNKRWMSRNAGRVGIFIVALLLLVWVITGDSGPENDAAVKRPEAVTVGLTDSRAEPVERLVRVQGHVEPEQVVRVRAKTSGEVVETPVDEGAMVEPDNLIVRLSMDDRQTRLREAKAAERRAQGDYDAAARLADQGFQARLAGERALAELESARARVATIELDIDRTGIKAPIGGVLNHQIARRGDVVAAGEPVAEIVDNDPLRAVIQLSQHRAHEVVEGQDARVIFLDGETRQGTVQYVSVMADEETRTFPARVRVANPDRDLPAGTSVTVEIPVATVHAHAISPALISQNEAGELGVKVAESDDAGKTRARFVRVFPVRANAERIWVTGLPETVRLISLGQGFVRDGDIVEESRAPESKP